MSKHQKALEIISNCDNEENCSIGFPTPAEKALRNSKMLLEDV